MWRWCKRLLVVGAVLAVVSAVAAAALIYPRYAEYQRIADSFDLSEINRIPALSEVFDNQGQRYSRLEGEVRYVVPFSEISPHFIEALLAREDNDFYRHHGVDLRGIVRAALRNYRAGKVVEGASTITQQLARNTFDLGDDKWQRKMIEALLAMRIERNFSKQEILEAYSNRIFYGVGLYGVETASRACFGKSAKDLDLSESAILAGLIRSPNRLSPLEDTQTALRERDQVLWQMQRLGMITEAEAGAARAEDMPLRKQRPPNVQRNHAIDAVLRDLAVVLPGKTIEQGGLRIYTTIDRRLQLLAEDAVDSELEKIENADDWPHPTRATAPKMDGENRTEYVQGALVVVDNKTGGILAMVGGRDYVESPYNRAMLAQRQIGSTFKPFVYAAAFEHGLLPGTLIDDAPLTQAELGGRDWDPENSDGENLGPTPVEVGLIRSRNTMTIRVGEIANLPTVRKLAAQAGLGGIPEGPAIYLGAFEVTLRDLTAAYTMFPNAGVRRQPYIIDHVVDRSGKTIYKATGASLRCLSPGTAALMNELLQDVVEKGTAASADGLGLDIPAAGKTGTTDDYKDAWFVGYSSRLTCGVWVGMDKPQRIAPRAYGSRMALPIWVRFMEEASRFKYEAGPLDSGSALEEVTLCRKSGLRAAPQCGTDAYSTELPSERIPRESCRAHEFTTAAPMGGIPVARAEPASQTQIPVQRATAAAPETPLPVRRAQPVPASDSGVRIVPIPGGYRYEYTD